MTVAVKNTTLGEKLFYLHSKKNPQSELTLVPGTQGPDLLVRLTWNWLTRKWGFWHGFYVSLTQFGFSLTRQWVWLPGTRNPDYGSEGFRVWCLILLIKVVWLLNNWKTMESCHKNTIFFLCQIKKALEKQTYYLQNNFEQNIQFFFYNYLLFLNTIFHGVEQKWNGTSQNFISFHFVKIMFTS